jgi:putative N-acetyltransferase (TIGR04045 family)
VLELTRPYGAALRPYISAQVTTAIAREHWELASYWALRRSIFCEETALFGSALQERDTNDDQARPIIALAHSAGTPDQVVGVVRIYEQAAGVWFGGRLGVERVYRAQGRVGASLVRMAVQTAIAYGCERFYATVLNENARYFERLAFVTQAPIELCGRPHVLMQARLSAYDAYGASTFATKSAA